MNERIRQLAEQAHRSTADELVHLQRVHNRTYDLNESAAIYNEKFAELMIRECCIALNPMLRNMISRGQGVDMIKLHFGMNPKEITTAMLDASIAQCEQELAKKKLGVEE
jgi:hypothetical protein